MEDVARLARFYHGSDHSIMDKESITSMYCKIYDMKYREVGKNIEIPQKREDLVR